MSLIVLCPSRNRPAAALELLASFDATRSNSTTRLVFIVDIDDPTVSEYPERKFVLDPPPGFMNVALAEGTRQVLALYPEATVLGFVGDDHRFRTTGWDIALGDFLLEHPGIGYANDGFQGEQLPTMWFVSRRIATAFGLGLEGLRHLWIDNYWKTLGDAADCLYYFPQLLIEHVHPAAGKTAWTEQYLTVNSATMAEHDQAVFARWQASDLERDAVRLRDLVAS